MQCVTFVATARRVATSTANFAGHSLGRSPKNGSATVHAEYVAGATSLVRVAHTSPARLLPVKTTATDKAGAAWCALGSFGGGLLGGDDIEINVRVGADASLALVTQASTKVYKSKSDGRPAKQYMDAHVGAGGLLLIAPDTLVPFANSAYEQRQCFRVASELATDITDSGSVVIVDWVGAGRLAGGEWWDFNSYSSRSEFWWQGEHSSTSSEHPSLIEAVALGRDLDTACAMGPYSVAASVVATGPRSEAVARNLHAAANALATRCAQDSCSGTRIANSDLDTGGFSLPALEGSIRMGVSDTVRSNRGESGGAATIARFVAESTEDVYRLLHACLLPLANHLGVEPYAERLHGSGKHVKRSSLVRAVPSKQTTKPSAARASEETLMSPIQQFTLMQLTDATLPTGGFGHSGGVEAALQLGVFGKDGSASPHEQSEDALRTFILAAARSNHRVQGAFVAAAHQVASDEGKSNALEEWHMLNSTLHAHLAGNAVACRASQQQGSALARTLTYWRSNDAASTSMPRRGHLAIVFGFMGAQLSLSLETTLQAHTYCAVRDMVSAAVRLNLIGPLRGLQLQTNMMHELVPFVASAGSLHDQTDTLAQAVSNAANTSPLVECSHAAHDLLHARLFLT